ncbi:MAG: IS66-like element accessory protein TnpA [Halocynthiibacter sp.]
MSKGKKRFWSDDEKRSICEQTCTAGVSVAQVARRYAMNANLIHKWLRDPRFGPDLEADEGCVDVPSFLPVEIEGMPAASSAAIARLSAHRVDITLSDGRRILVEGTRPHRKVSS